ncbi:MAG: acyl-CoA dehydrogenase [Proteobacteria bacterium]|nr:acyl-CoA dehydrogenase [Pseudomonadota bacterium]
MVDFSINEKDQEVLDEGSRFKAVTEKYARYYDDNEEELVPQEFPEAKDWDHLPMLNMERMQAEGVTKPATFSLLQEITNCMGTGNISLREMRYGLGNAALMAAGTDEQKKKWGQTFLAMAITEPGCGSDSKAIETTAELDGDHWILNGEKIFVTSGIKCEGLVVWATLDRSQGRGAIKSFLVEKGTPGFELAKKEKKLGIRASDTAAFVLKNCRIPRENLLGGNEEIVQKKGGGFKGLMATFNMTRPGVGAGGTGVVNHSYRIINEELKKEGVEVDWELGPQKRTALQEKLVELGAQIESSALTVYRAAWLTDCGKPNNLESSVCKAKGGDVSRYGAQLALEILGATGITHDLLVEKAFRDARITDIYEGTGEINHLIIARALLGYSSADLM